MALDELDQRVISALQINGRASWQQIARAVGSSDSTVARRAQRLMDDGTIRVVGSADPLRCGFGYPVLVQIKCAVGRAPSVAASLTARPDVRFLSMITGSFDIVLELIVTSRRHLGKVLLEEINLISGIQSTTTESVLRHYKMSHEWSQGLLAEAALDELRPAPEPDGEARPLGLDNREAAILQQLAIDGRRSISEIAEQLDMTESSARRKLDAMVTDGRIRFSTIVDAQAMGYDVEMFLWLRVDLSQLEDTAQVLASCTGVRYLAATAGFADLAVEVILKDQEDLYRFNTQVLGSLPGLRSNELGLELGTLKRAFVRLDEPASVDRATAPTQSGLPAVVEAS